MEFIAAELKDKEGLGKVVETVKKRVADRIRHQEENVKLESHAGPIRALLQYSR